MADWATTVPSDSAWTVVDNQYIKKVRYQSTWGIITGTQTAVQHIRVTEYDGVTAAAADGYAAAHVSDTNISIKVTRSNSGGGYKIVKTLDSMGEYTTDT